MAQRIVTGVILAFMALGLIFYASLPLLMAVAVAASTFAYFEFDRLFFIVRFRSRPFRIVLLIFFTLLAMRVSEQWGAVALWSSFVIFCVFQIYHWRNASEFDRAIRAIALEWLGYFYCVSIFGFLVPIAAFDQGRVFLLLLFLIVFGGDTAAYFVGSRFGKHKIVPKLSPKKSWEGSLAAFACALGVTFVWLNFVDTTNFPENHRVVFAGVALGVSLLAQVGDFFESLLKRSQSQKDSGSLLPGHGGILDRIDGLALSAPFFYAFMTWVSP